jgi:nickel-dependent lactate racemase
MSVFCAKGSVDTDFTPGRLNELFTQTLAGLGERNRVMVVPPDQSREHSRAGELTGYAWQYYGDRLKVVLPALGTHTPMRPDQLDHMFSGVPHNLFKVHNWRTDVETLGEVPAEFIRELSEDKLDFSWPVQVNRLVSQGGFDLILSIGQVVPHEVIGMANYNKNILVGTGGPDGINRSHYLSAVYGSERIMGRAVNPVRTLLNYASDHFLNHLPIVYAMTVIGPRPDGTLAVRGLFIGDDVEAFNLAAELSLKVNFEMVEEPIRKAIVYLQPEEFHSTWIGNKAVYRTRMALADGADLIILAPGVREFGEDTTIDGMIRKYGYFGTPATLEAVKKNADLAANLGAAAHLIHSSSEGRFNITWCPGMLSREEIEGVGFQYDELAEMMKRYDPAKLKPGYNRVDGEDVFFIANPALGLWAESSRFAGTAAQVPAAAIHR